MATRVVLFCRAIMLPRPWFPCWWLELFIRVWPSLSAFGCLMLAQLRALRPIFFPSSQLFQLDQVFYAGLAYLIIFTAVYILGRFLGIFANLIPYPNKLDTKWYNVTSGAIAVCISIFVLGMCLTIFSDGADGDGSGAAQQQLYDSLYCQVYPYHIQYPQRSLGESSYRIKDDSVGLLAGFFFY